MGLPVTTKTRVDLQVSEEIQRLVAMKSATDLACASIAVGNSFEMPEVFTKADEILAWLKRGSDDSPDARKP